MTDPKPPSNRDEPQEQEKWYERTRYQILLFAGGIALFGLVLGLILDWYINPQTSTQKKDLVQALGLITAGVAGAVGIFFTWRGQRQAREAQEENQRNTQAQLRHAQEELSLTRQGQITERFTRAIDQLGNESLEIRLGGIYALERIARDSEEDHWPIMEVLTAYVRQHAPSRPEGGQQGEEDATTEKPGEDSGGLRGESVPTEVPAFAPDIRAIITVIGRRTRHYKHGEPEPLNLVRTNLSRAPLSGANLSGAVLAGANLSRAFFRRANLSRANFMEADLSRAILEEANLSRAFLTRANLSGAFFPRANLSGAFLTRANLSRAKLLGADLSGANLSEARGLLPAQLDETKGDKNTQLPAHLRPPAHWGVKTDEQIEAD